MADIAISHLEVAQAESDNGYMATGKKDISLYTIICMAEPPEILELQFNCSFHATFQLCGIDLAGRSAGD